MAFPINKRANNELFIDRTVDLYIQNGWIKNTVRVVATIGTGGA